MPLGRSLAVALLGVQGHVVEVEADIAPGLPAFTLVGLPDASLVEARDRVRAASANAGCALPSRRITVNLSPAALPKTGTGFDLGVAAALWSAAGWVSRASTESWMHVGELGLDGRVRPVRGVLPCVMAAVRAGVRQVVVPRGNEVEARLVPDVTVRTVGHLLDLFDLHGGERPAARPPEEDGVEDPHPTPGAGGVPAHTGSVSAPVLSGGGDLADVVGQREGRRAVEIAAAGGHHLLLLGPPGAGKTMLASRLPGLLPDLDDVHALEVTAVHSVAGTLEPGRGLLRRPPFEDPHHTATVTALVGGGSGLPRPGAASRAHRGVLFLDEAAEFAPRALDALRQPLEQGELTIHRAMGVARFPARFQLVLAANPCPCGRSVGKGTACTCTPLARRRYLSRLSGPLVDRIDLQVHVHPVSRAEMAAEGRAESSAAVGRRVAQARETQRERLAGTPWACNGEVPGAWLRGPARLRPGATRDLDRALDRQQITVRGYDRVLRIAWTISDLDGRAGPERDDVGQALLFRCRPGTSS